MRRRDFIAALGGAVAWPLASQGQQAPVVSYLQFGQTFGDLKDEMTAPWLAGLKEFGFDNGCRRPYRHRGCVEAQ